LENKERKRKVFRVSPEFIIALLHQGEHHYLVEHGFPKTVTKPLCTQFEIDEGLIGILVEDESFDEVPEGRLYPRLDVRITTLERHSPSTEVSVVASADKGMEFTQGDMKIYISPSEIPYVRTMIDAIVEAREKGAKNGE
jgi:hypothetical protein